MILDNNLRLGSVTLTATGTYDFPDVVDLRNNTAYTATASGSLYTVAQGNQNVEISEGTTLYVVFTVTTALAASTDPIYQVVLADDTGLDTNVVVIGEYSPSTAIAVGTQVVIPIGSQLLAAAQKRYLGANVVTSAGSGSGVISADIVLNYQDGRNFYASGFTVA
jgi:hypothetical protein